ncbi:MAG: macro domain-containing protein, partial [Halieaceae bacterium]|nr:macro domain-containing protein [Halieaceae bacterium]
MLHEVTGDILLSKAHAIAHGVAANDPMNQGLALSLHQRYPAMHKDFHHWCHVNHPKVGEAWMWGGAGNVRVVNLITQEGGHDHGSRPGKATTKAVNDSLKALVKMVSDEGFTSLAIPRLATGVGGLDWEDVRPLVEQRLGELDIPVYVYTEYHA